MRRITHLLAAVTIALFAFSIHFPIVKVKAEAVVDQYNPGSGPLTTLATLETPYSFLVQPFRPSYSLPVTKIELPLCITGNPADLQSYVFTGVEIWDFDSVNGKPIRNTIAQSSPINMTELSDCSNGFTTVSVDFIYNPEFPPPGEPFHVPPRLIAEKQYAIAIGTSLFNDADNTLNWGATGYEVELGSMYRSTENNAWFDSWEELQMTAGYTEYYDDSVSPIPFIDRFNTNTVTGGANITTAYGLQAQPFVATDDRVPHIIRLPLCITGEPVELNEYFGAAVNIIEFDTVNNVPQYNIVAQGNGANMAALPDCSIGYAIHSAYFPSEVHLEAGKKYALLLQASAFNNPTHTLVWAKTAVNNALGAAYSSPSPAPGNVWTQENYSLVFEEYVLGEAPLSTIHDFVIFGSDGVFIKANSQVTSGDVGVDNIQNQFLDSGVELSIGNNTQIINPSSDIYADSVKLKAGSQINNLFYNDKSGTGSVLGSSTTPFDFPFINSLPDSGPGYEPGNLDLTLDVDLTDTLAAGNYRKLLLKKNSTLILSGGNYNFESIDMKEGAKLYADAATVISVNGRISTDAKAEFKPNPGASIDASDIKLYVAGMNGTTGEITATPKAADFGSENKIEANIFVPSGTLIIRQKANITGAFVAEWIVIGEQSTVSLDSAF